jgi:hypothetical protein
MAATVFRTLPDTFSLPFNASLHKVHKVFLGLLLAIMEKKNENTRCVMTWLRLRVEGL